MAVPPDAVEGQRPSASFLNWLKAEILRENSFATGGVESLGSHQFQIGTSGKCQFNCRSSEGLDIFSVFGIVEDTVAPYNKAVKSSDSSNRNLYTNGEKVADVDQEFHPIPCTKFNIYKLATDETNPPDVGDFARPKNDTYVVEKGGRDFLCLTAPDIDEDWGLFLALPNENSCVLRPVEASACILPGDGGEVLEYVQDSEGEWTQDPDEKTNTLIDPFFQVCALPGEIFWVMETKLADTVIPASDFGLKRRIKVDTAMDCGTPGTAVIQRQVNADPCDWEDTSCEIDICNDSNRKIICHSSIPYEMGWARFVFDESADGMDGDRGWHIEMDRMAMEAEVTISTALNSSSLAAGNISSYSYLDVCEWTEDITLQTILNPYNRKACSGKKLYLRRSGADCQWRVVSAEAISERHYASFTTCGEEDCNDFSSNYYTDAAVEVSNCTPTTNIEIPFSTEYMCVGWRIDTGVGEDECNMIPQLQAICVPDCNTSEGIIDGTPMELETTEMTEDIRLVAGSGIWRTTKHVFSICPPLDGDDALVIATETCEEEQPVEDI